MDPSDSTSQACYEKWSHGCLLSICLLVSTSSQFAEVAAHLYTCSLCLLFFWLAFFPTYTCLGIEMEFVGRKFGLKRWFWVKEVCILYLSVPVRETWPLYLSVSEWGVASVSIGSSEGDMASVSIRWRWSRWMRYGLYLSVQLKEVWPFYSLQKNSTNTKCIVFKTSPDVVNAFYATW